MAEADEQPVLMGTPLPGSRHYVSGFNLLPLNASEVIIIASSPIAAASPDGVVGGAMLPVVQLTMSRVACKELALLLQQQVAAMESQAGPITSDWISQHEQSQAQE